jgi:hypothetical protein
MVYGKPTIATHYQCRPVRLLHMIPRHQHHLWSYRTAQLRELLIIQCIRKHSTKSPRREVERRSGPAKDRP